MPKEIAKFLGQSGDRVGFLKVHGSLVVVKSAGAQSASRLATQAEKQASFDLPDSINVPEILEPWNGNSFTMQYVSGVSLGQYLRLASHSEVLGLASVLCQFIDHNFNASRHDGRALHDNSFFKAKLSELRRSLGDSINSRAQRSITAIEHTSRDVPFLSGPNHGDFSFENVIVNPNDHRVSLIDFLNSPFDSPLIDVGRILIDLDHGWWVSGVESAAAEFTARRVISREIRSLCKVRGIQSAAISLFKCFAAIRMLPYTLNPVRRAILDQVLDTELERLTGRDNS